MKIHCIQHVKFETLETISERRKKESIISRLHAYTRMRTPELDSFDLFIIMGGPMNIFEYKKYPGLGRKRVY